MILPLKSQAAAMASLAGCDYPTDVEARLRWYHDDILEPLLTVRDDTFWDSGIRSLEFVDVPDLQVGEGSTWSVGTA